jgi:Tol biopolymer transport system component
MTLAAGMRLGPYEIVRPLGSGGMGEVYTARDTRLDREVAVKVLPEQLAQDADALGRFEREAKAVAALSHPNILALHDFGREGDVVYAVTELLEGETLRDMIDGGPIAQRRAIEYAVQIARGLSAAHGRGIVHRDLKPDNVFVTRDGRVKILDFGLAKSVRVAAPQDDTRSPTASAYTEPGTVLGTVGYMSPEQVRGGEADARSDIFSFGTVLYEMLAGKRAFRRETAVETMSAILREEPAELSSVLPSVSPALERIVRHCLEKSPEQRFESARDMAFDLEALSDRSLTSGTAHSGAGRRRAPWIAVAAAAAIAAAGVGLALRLAGRPPEEPPQLSYLTFSGSDSMPAASPDGRMIAFMSTRDGTPRIWLKQLAGGAEAPLSAGKDSFPRFSPDGASILFTRYASAQPSLWRVATVGGAPRKILDDASDGDWSPDGRRIAFLRSVHSGSSEVAELATAGSDGGSVKVLLRRPSHRFSGPRWSPDGKSIAVSDGTSETNSAEVLVVPINGGPPVVTRLPERLGIEAGGANPAFISRPGEILYPQCGTASSYTAGAFSRLVLQKIGSSRARTMAWVPGEVSRLDVVSPGAVVVASTVTRSGLRELALSDGRVQPGTRWLTHGNSNDAEPRFSPDGSRLAFMSSRGGSLDIWTLSMDTGTLLRITDDPAQEWDPAFTSDGTSLLFSSNRSGRFEIWKAAADGSGGATRLTHCDSDCENPVASPDGQWIAYEELGSSTGKAGIWKARADGSDPRLLVAGALAWPEISPDGKYIAAGGMKVGLASPVAVAVYRFSDGTPTAFRAEVWTSGTGASSRWMPDGKSIAFLGFDGKLNIGVYVQDFDPNHDTTATRRELAGFDSPIQTQTFGISPDGKRLVLEGPEGAQSLLLVSGLEGIAPGH